MVEQLVFITGACSCFVPAAVLATRLVRESPLTERMNNHSSMEAMRELDQPKLPLEAEGEFLRYLSNIFLCTLYRSVYIIRPGI
jgi:hypothetical protein